MGNFFGKKKDKFASVIPQEEVETVKTINTLEGILEDFAPELVQWEERQKILNEQCLKHMKQTFLERPDNFVSALIILSTQFYENFDKERDEISRYVRDRELEYNDQVAPYRRRVQFIGAHEVISASHVLYFPRGANYYEMPGYKQYFVIQDNVQLFPEEEYEENKDANYSEIDGTSYRFSVETSVRHKGYVRLRCVDIVEGVSRSNTYEDIYRAIKPAKEDEPDLLLDRRPILRRPSAEMEDEAPGFDFRQRRLSGVLPSGYNVNLHAKIQSVDEDIKTLKKTNGISKVIDNSISNRKKQFQNQRVPAFAKPNINNPAFDGVKASLAKIEEPEEEEAEDWDEDLNIDANTLSAIADNNGSLSSQDSQTDSKTPEWNAKIRPECFLNKRLKVKSIHDVYNLYKMENSERRTYLSSERYRIMFEDDFEEFLKVVRKQDLLEFTDVEEPAKIIAHVNEDRLMLKTEYIPAFSYKRWPDCASEWVNRPRKQRIDPAIKMTYSWPKRRHIEEIVQHHGCTLVPMGYYNPRDPNRIMLIEWQVFFVKAEQILLRSLGHQQIRVLLIIQLLFRDYVERDDVRPLKPQHLRYILFWLCEDNYKNWQDDRIYMKVKAYLKTLYNALSEGVLPHYFCRDVNILDNIKAKDLRTVQESVKRILENLPMFLIRCMSRLRTAPNFYPQLDFKRVYNLVKVKKYGITEMNPALAGAIQGSDDSDNANEDSSDEEDEDDKKLKERLHAERDRRNSIIMEQIRLKEPKKKTKEKPKAQTKSGINLDIKIRKINDLRAERLLTTFSYHFLEIAEYSNKFGDHQQAARYLNYARNMLDILRDEDMDCPSVMEGTLEEIERYINREWNVMRQGLNSMLNNTHKLTDTLELKMAHPPAAPNWELKKSQEHVQKTYETTKNKTQFQLELENRTPPKATKMPKKDKIEMGMSKSLSDLTQTEKSQNAKDPKVLYFKVASDDEDESTDL